MNITIGEISDIILPFTTTMNTFIFSEFPCIQASIGNANYASKLFITIKQVMEHTYSAAVTDDVYNGNRILPTDSIDNPFIKEKDFLNKESIIDCQKNLSVSQFHVWFYKTLYQYQIIRFNPAYWTKRFIDLGFNSMKIKRVITKAYRSLNCGKLDIRELMTVVNTPGRKFDLTELEDKEIRCVYAKLKSLGLEVIIQDKYIVHIEYERRA